MINNFWTYVFIAFSVTGICRGLFVPEQLPTLLSFLYTNIPPVRKGTDSRVGFGFRLGPNADFQVLFELGPQQNTAPIGVASDSSSNAKRDTVRPPASWLEHWKSKQNEVLEDGTKKEPGFIYMDKDVVDHLKQLYLKVEKSNQTNLEKE